VARDKLKDAKRKEAWAATKTAVHAYAKNPCRATEIDVEAAFDKVKTLTEAVESEATGSGAKDSKAPLPGQSKRKSKKPSAP